MYKISCPFGNKNSLVAQDFLRGAVFLGGQKTHHDVMVDNMKKKCYIFQDFLYGSVFPSKKL